jgi:hypothetical protein
MRLSIASPNPQRLTEMVALAQRLDTALLGNEGFQKKMASLEGISFLNWSINGYDYNENYRKAGVHMIKVFLCRGIRVLHPMAIDGHCEVMSETESSQIVCVRSSCDTEIRTDGKGLKISSSFSRGATQTEAEFTRDLIDYMTADCYLGKWCDDHDK